MCGMAVTIWSTCGFERKVCVVWLLQLGQLVVLSVSICGMPVLIGQLVVLSVNMCGMAVTIWSTCGFERKYVWYGCYN